jgi:hypothetical protein
MTTVDRRIPAWVDAGLISSEQAEHILAFEHSRDDPATSKKPSAISPAEAIGYVGAALALGAIALILNDLWRELLIGGRLVLVGVLTVALFGAGLAVRSSAAAAMQRLTSVLFTATVAGVGWFVAVTAGDLLDLRSAAVGVAVGVATVVVAAALYLWTPRALLQIAVLLSALIAPVAALDLGQISPSPAWYGLVVGAIGAAWFLVAAGGWLASRVVGEVSGAMVAFIGVQIGSFSDARTLGLTIGVVVAAGLVALAIRTDRLHHLIIGALALFVLSPQLVFEVFGDQIGAPATLLLVGLLLVLLAVGLGRARREVTTTATTGRKAAR